jgi:hypothetical protein
MLASTVAMPHATKVAGLPSDEDPSVAAPVSASKPSAPIARVAVPAPAPKTVAPVARVTAAPTPAPAPMAIAVASKRATISLPAMTIMITSAMTQATGSAASAKGDYIDQMRAAGYNVDLDKYVAMKIQGVTPEFAQSMATTGFGKPTADQLVAMKIHGVTPGEVAELKAAGIEAGSYQDLIKYRIFNVSPEFVAGMKAAGYTNLPAKKLVELRIQGVTPEFAKATKQQWPDATVDQLVQLRILNINGAFIASAKRHGLEPLTIEKLVKIRISGVLDDEDQKSEKTQ